jgi:cytochrome c-type biogenesis protein CcmF
VLAGVTGEETAELRIAFNPLVWWVWYGGLVMALGGLVVMWPQAERKKQGGYAAVLPPGAGYASPAREPAEPAESAEPALAGD